MPIRITIETWIAALLLAGLFSTSCEKVEKDATAYYPKVATQSAAVQPDGSVLVTGGLTDPGRGDLYFLGFCMDTVPQPQMHIG